MRRATVSTRYFLARSISNPSTTPGKGYKFLDSIIRLVVFQNLQHLFRF